MFFSHDSINVRKGQFIFGKDVCVKANACIDSKILKELWHGFSFRSSQMKVEKCDELIFSIGEVCLPETNGELYAISVTENGFCVTSESEYGLKKGFLTLIDRIEAVELSEDTSVLKIDCCEICESPVIPNSMVHFCISPETELWELHKFVRLCGALKFSHLVLEFWGMYKYDCLKELSWSHGYTKEEIKPIIKEANDMGLEIIPMFNHWGHATGSRVMHGKHVVLDQNPSLQTLFDDSGWCWAIEKPQVRQLLKNIRRELMDLCGEGKYFHVGCDEAYGFDYSEKNQKAICDFLNEVSEDCKLDGRRILVWGDMLITKNRDFEIDNSYICACPDKEKEEFFFNHLSKEIIIADWQYNVKQYPVESAKIFKDAGFDVILCPWDRSNEATDACVETVKKENLYGLMHTTWHTLSWGTMHVGRTATRCWQNEPQEVRNPVYAANTASMLRKVYFTDGDYKKAGWSKIQFGVVTG